MKQDQPCTNSRKHENRRTCRRSTNPNRGLRRHVRSAHHSSHSLQTHSTALQRTAQTFCLCKKRNEKIRSDICSLEYQCHCKRSCYRGTHTKRDCRGFIRSLRSKDAEAMAVPLGLNLLAYTSPCRQYTHGMISTQRVTDAIEA